MKRYLLIPDQHVPYNDPRYWDLIKKVARFLKPQGTVVCGDFLDCYTVSSHSKDPARKLTLQDEVNTAFNMLRELVDIGGKELHYIEGNHEDRLRRYLWDKAPELHGLITIDKLLDLKDLGFKFTPYRESLKIGKAYVTHDLGSAGKYAHFKALEDHGTNIAIGHTHRLGITYRGAIQGKPHFGAMLGWGGDVSQIDYMHKDQAKVYWQHGFGILYVDKSGLSYLDVKPVVEYRTIVEGQLLSA